jgi:hypothetical protein
MLSSISNSVHTFWDSVSTKFGIAYASLTLSLNIILTLMIAGRLLRMKSLVKSALGGQASSMYTSVSAILIESAALYSTWLTAFLISYSLNNPVQNLLLPTFAQIQVDSFNILCHVKTEVFIVLFLSRPFLHF